MKYKCVIFVIVFIVLSFLFFIPYFFPASIGFLNTYKEFYQILITGILVLLTGAYVYLSDRQTNLLTIQANLLTKSFEPLVIPVLSYHPDNQVSGFYIDIINVGGSPAMKIKCHIAVLPEPRILHSSRNVSKDIKDLEKDVSIFILPKNHHYSKLIEYNTSSKMIVNSKTKLTVSIDYVDLAGKKYPTYVEDIIFSDFDFLVAKDNTKIDIKVENDGIARYGP